MVKATLRGAAPISETQAGEGFRRSHSKLLAELGAEPRRPAPTPPCFHLAALSELEGLASYSPCDRGSHANWEAESECPGLSQQQLDRSPGLGSGACPMPSECPRKDEERLVAPLRTRPAALQRGSGSRIRVPGLRRRLVTRETRRAACGCLGNLAGAAAPGARAPDLPRGAQSLRRSRRVAFGTERHLSPSGRRGGVVL